METGTIKTELLKGLRKRAEPQCSAEMNCQGPELKTSKMWPKERVGRGGDLADRAKASFLFQKNVPQRAQT